MSPAAEMPKPNPPQRGRRRSAARLAAVQALYQIDMTGVLPGTTEVDRVVREFARHRFGQDMDGGGMVEADEALFRDIVGGVSARWRDIDGIVGPALSAEWPIERLETILRAILRAGAYELMARIDVPPRVVISEYLDVAHAFFGAKEPALVNGVLDRLARSLRPDEMGR
jgi:N utilization substance protein B